MKKILYLSIVSILLISSCKKEDVTPSNSPYDVNKMGYVTLHFDNKVGNLELVLDSPFYTNTLNQSYTISKLNYFISNLIFVNEDGTTYTVPQDSSYFLIEETDSESSEITLRIPEGNYKKVRFTIGVDSLRSTLPLTDRTGDLDVSGTAAGMYWTWNSGYIFMKMEGTYNDPTDTVADSQTYMYHIGGFGPAINNIKNTEINFNGLEASVRQSKGSAAPEIHIYVDASKVITGPTNVNFVTNPIVMFATFSIDIANNYANMFSLAHIHND